MELMERVHRKISSFLTKKILPCTDEEYESRVVYEPSVFEFPQYTSLSGSKDFESYSADVPDFGVYILDCGKYISGFEEVYSSKNHVLEKITSQHVNPRVGCKLVLKPQKFIDGTVAVLSLSGLEKNYYHFNVEFLLRWWILKQSGIEPDYYAAFTGENDCSFQSQMFDILGIPKGKILSIPQGTVVQAKKLVCPSLVNNWEHGNWRGFPAFNKIWLPMWARDCYGYVVSKVLDENRISNFSPYVYVDRKNAPGRKIINSDEFFLILEKYGFEKVCLEKMNVREQILLFHNARMVVAPHGAGLVNLSWCNQNTKVLELYPQYYHDPSFRIHSTALKLDYNYMICRTPEIEGVEPVSENIYVDNIALIENWIRENII